MAVAFVKVGPLIRLQAEIEKWIAIGKSIEAIWGINHKGTSEQAIAFALNFFRKTYVVFAGDNITFHPKMYVFSGARKCCIFIGSHNLTVGGTETNWEGGVKLDLRLPDDQATMNEMMAAWKSLLPYAVELTEANYSGFISMGLLLDESKISRSRPTTSGTESKGEAASEPAIKFPKITAKPPSSIPASAFAPKRSPVTKLKSGNAPIFKGKTSAKAAAQALVIQIVPHHNGEVFLSKIAINQNPDFFGFPFTGRTTPKFPSNPSYPQRVPDPVVNLTVYDSAGNSVVRLLRFHLNTVYYEAKSEIRITVPTDVVKHTPHYSVMVMRQAPGESDYDFDLDIFPPTSAQFTQYLEVCNQTLPSGGKATARRMGWL